MIICSPTIRGSGAITGVFRSSNGGTLAIASTFPLLTNPPGRAAYMGQRLRQRLALHRRGELRPFAVFDDLRMPINDVSFHPSDPVIAVAAGSYDGGYLFEGELLFWNWQADRSWRAAKTVPEVERCDFTEDGNGLDVLVRPWDEDWGVDDDPFDRVYPLSVPYGGPSGSDGGGIEIDPGQAIVRHTLEYARNDPRRHDGIDQELCQWFGVDRISRRGPIWDVAWVDGNRLAAVDNDCLVEIHDLADGSVTSLRKDGYHGASLLRTSPPVVASYAMEGWQIRHSQLLAISDDTLVKIATFEGSYNFVSSMDGRVLGRLDRSLVRDGKSDVMVDIKTGDVRLVSLGHYDCFNHFLGIDGAPDLFILQGTPKTQHEKKRLCRVRADGSVETLWYLLPPDGSHESHAMECLGCYIDDELGPGVVVSGRHYDPNPSKGNRGFIFRRPIEQSRFARRGFGLSRLSDDRKVQEAWRLATTAVASAIVHAPKEKLIVVAYLDGTLSLLNAADGTVVMAGQVTIESHPTVIYSMDVVDASLAVGTFDGRIAVIELDQLRNGERNGRIELG